MPLPRDRYILRSHEPQIRTGTGRRQQLVSMESFGGHQIADLLIRVETLLAQGYILSINPPAQPPTVDADLCADPANTTITVLAS